MARLRIFRVLRVRWWLRIAVAAVVLLAAVHLAAPGSRPIAPGMRLVSGTAFSLSGTATGLAPGAASTLMLNAANTYNVPITVTSVTVSVPTVPAGCPLSNLTINSQAFSGGSVTVTGLSQLVAANNSANISLPILVASGAPSGCQNTTFNFNYSGSAAYTEPTGTTLTSAPNPSASGSPVTFTATVAGTVTPGMGDETPVGSVTFYECTNPANLAAGSPASSCTTSVALGASVPVNASGQAMLATSSLSVGTHPIFASFTPTDSTSFTQSSSTSITQTVTSTTTPSCVSISTVGATVITGTVKGDYKVKNGDTVWLNGGTIGGTVSVDKTGKFIATNGTIGKDVNSAGGPVSLQATTVNGNVNAGPAPLALLAGTTVGPPGPGGNVNVNGSNTLCMLGSNTSSVQIAGNVNVEHMTTGGTSPASFCKTQVIGNFNYHDNAVAVVIGGSSACAGNTFGVGSGAKDDFTVNNNTAKVTIGGAGFGNTVNGNITVQNNKVGVGGTLTSNSAVGGTCTLQGNKPPIVGSGNTATGKNTCNATA